MAPDEHAAVASAFNRLKELWKFGSSTQNMKVLDAGSQDVNGNLRDIFEPTMKYIGLDMVDGKNVDVVGPMSAIPFPDNHFHVVVSNSAFEHDLTWWLSLEEMKRVLVPGGMLIIGACSLGFVYHGYPAYGFRDYYRFTTDVYEDYILKGLKHTDIIQVQTCGPLRLVGSGILEGHVREGFD